MCVLFIVSGCGKNIPAIDPALLQNKQSVLLITEPNLPDTTKSLISKTLSSWKDKEFIANEWLPDVTSLSEEQVNKIHSVAYDYIIVAGNGLNQQVLPYIGTTPDKKWILLDNAIDRTETPVSATNLEWKRSGAEFMRSQWGEWVKQQQAMGKAIEWVTASANPIPSEWAPSEEAEYISLSDAEGWYPQFQNQVKQHAPDWIAVYSPLEANVLQRMKNLQVPVMNMAATSVALKWDTVLNGILDQMKNKRWTPGIQNYTDQEITINKPQ
ncbi:hypothetical protein N0M98_16955 [Paenibacillus doosanensis]|uniref:hypothetical protein n=1 Tax=Paenibacillus doosanensis TaxID=1229154 RepID=UPI00218022D3|nr:hypothetical protein [Paenibacillus doosanensis]MCS7461827.1 hypothetical protein [Paenibacillus doosanensis]